MLELDNLTGFPAQNYIAIDQHDRGFDVIATRVTYDLQFSLDGSSELKFATIQSPLCFVDEHYGDPQKTSVIIENDLSPYKPYLDVVIVGTAYAPFDKPCKRFGVSVKVGEKQKILAVTGPRCWERHSLGWSLAEPVAIAELPLKYEYAFGGSQQVEEKLEISPYNHLGVGWYSPEFLRKFSTGGILSGPQIMDPNHPVEDLSRPIKTEGFGFYGRTWRERLEYGGTADQKWLDERHPLLPSDFDMHYWNGAHPDLQFKHPAPNHIYDISVSGMVRAMDVPKQSVLIQLPVETLFVYVKTQENIGLALDLTLDTVVINMDERKLNCTYRLCLAEEMFSDKAELRFIARSERSQQIELASQMEAQKNSFFIPLPPSIMAGVKNKLTK